MNPILLTVIIVISSIAFLFVLTLILNILAFKPPRYNKSKYSGDLHENHKDIATYLPFKSGNTTLRGFLYKNVNPKGLIIFCHGIGSSSDYYIPEILKWYELGYNVYAFDYKGYWENKGIFCGVTQVLYDLKNAIEFIDDGSLPITLMGHSLGGYAVQSVHKFLRKKHNIKNIISVSGFSVQLQVLAELFKKLKIWKPFAILFEGALRLGQSVFFRKDWTTNAHEVINSHNVNTLVIQSINDTEVCVTGSAIYAKKKLIRENVHFELFTEYPYDSHMGIVRGGGDGTINEEMFKFILENLDK